MDRRKFLQTASASVGGAVVYRPGVLAMAADSGSDQPLQLTPGLAAYSAMAEFEYAGEIWKVYEDWRSREGDLVFVSGQKIHRLSKTAEAISADPAQGSKPYLGLSLEEVVGSRSDVLAERILSRGGDPDENVVRNAVPPLGTPPPALPESMWGITAAQAFTPGTFVGTKEGFDTQPILADGSTPTFTAKQYCPEITSVVSAGRFFDGLVGGWLPIVRKVFPIEEDRYWEILGFADTEKRERFIVHTWHRVAHIHKDAVTRVFYRHTYPPFRPVRQLPSPKEFYRGLLALALYWEGHLAAFRPLTLPRQDWADMAKHAFVKELIVRPGGVYPKYGAVDRIYGGSEHDGFPDTFTNAVYANLEWGCFETAKAFIENYFDEFVDERGAINYRGPEMGQYGLMLALLAKFYRYTGDASVLLRYQGKLHAIAGLLSELHHESLKLPAGDRGHGLIHGWSEADTNGTPDPDRYWLPYFGNSAFAIRGFRDLGGAWREIAHSAKQAALERWADDLIARSQQLQKALIDSIQRSVRTDLDPPHVGALAGVEPDEASPLEPSGYATRSYMELLTADVLPPELANLVINCLRAYGGTTLGIPGALRDEKAQERSLTGFTTYGYAQTLLRLERTEEFILFLYSHRYHCHLRGHWTAREAAGISRRPDSYIDPYCTPAQQAIPLLLRWMLVLEDSDEERLYLGRGIPRSWLASGKPIRIQHAPTRWGGVSIRLAVEPEARTLHAEVEFSRTGPTPEQHLTLRVPEGMRLQTATVNGAPARRVGPRGETVLVEPNTGRKFEVNARYG
jgi:hypothetical protein